MTNERLNSSPLAKNVVYPTQHDPSLLFALPRAPQRASLERQPSTWFGQDIWHAYELSWLTPSGRPQVALGRFIFPHDSPNLIESKSLKLYLNSLNETSFASTAELQQCLVTNLSAIADAAVQVAVFTVDAAPTMYPSTLGGQLIDDAPFHQPPKTPTGKHLSCGPTLVKDHVLVSHLLKSNCLVTQQPDWGSLVIRYTGPKINPSRLLEYIVSYRYHNEFHEHCVERIFCDLLYHCQPEKLMVQAFYTRRGGLDINPWRSTHDEPPTPQRSIRQ